MNLLAIAFPSVDPIAFEIGPLAVRWYGIAYMAGLLLGWLYMRRLLDQERLWRGAPPLLPDDADTMLLYITFGVVGGGRLGFFLLYEPAALLADPLEFFRVWHGGMAFHGGLVGCGVALLIFARLKRIGLLSCIDLAAATVPFGLLFGRIANFVNGELWGKPTDVGWAMVFPDPAAGGVPRHPSQLYEAALEGLLLFLVLRWLTHSRLKFKQPGFVAGAFLIGYGLARISAEIFREWDPTPLFQFDWLSSGQVYSLPMLVLGLILVVRARARPAVAP